LKVPNLLLVEDDKTLGISLKERLAKEGYKVALSETIFKAKVELAKFKPDLIILDVGLPDGNGFDFAKSLKNPPPFLFLTAMSTAEDRLKGFELGAEEFIPKPFHLKELLLRVKHVLNSHKHISESLESIYKVKNFRIDFEKLVIIPDRGEMISLSARDSILLRLLIEEKKRVVSRDEILDKIWGEEKFPSNRTIDNSIVRLRQAFGKNGNKYIKSIRSIGYRWVGED
jgi:DNA-binding response OmpR family regulator